MATDEAGIGPITDVNCVLPLVNAVPESVTELWAVDTEEVRRGSAGGAGPRDADGLAAAVRWQFAAVPPFDGSGVAMAIGSAKGPGPRVVRLHPGLHGGYPLASWLLAPLPELCDTADVAIVLDYTASLSVPWVEIVELARRNPSLCLVCVGGGRNGELGVLRAFLDAVANVVVELSALDDPAWLTRAVSEVGAHRFVFGSGGDQSRAVALLESASLAPEDAALVASGVAGLIDQGSWTETWL